MLKRHRTIAVGALAFAFALAGCGGGSGSARRAAPPGGPAKPGPASVSIARPGFSIVAVAPAGKVTLYAAPEASRPLRIQRTPDPRFPLVLLVKQAVPGWLRVYLPVRPNQSTAWIRQAAVRLRYNPYRVEVDLHRHRLTVRRSGRLIDDQPVAIGAVVTPTPAGIYYIIQQFRLSDPGGPYGPYALGLSAYSNVLKTFGTGPGQIALHGTNDPGGIGANVSHGCIHLRNAEIARLAHLLPLGTPVQMRA